MDRVFTLVFWECKTYVISYQGGSHSAAKLNKMPRLKYSLIYLHHTLTLDADLAASLIQEGGGTPLYLCATSNVVIVGYKSEYSSSHVLLASGEVNM